MALETRYDSKKVESNKYENWLKNGYFTAGDKSKPKFSMVIPPPNVTGKLHIGHTLDNTIQDITCRYKKAQGFDVLFLPGCDHAGIATQAKVDQLLQSQGIDRFKIGREKFLEEAFKWKDEYSKIIHQQWAKTGLMLDYSRERFTLDEHFSKAVYLVFKQLYENGLIYRGERIVNYDPILKTALSNIEVVYSEDEGYFYHIKYRLKENINEYVIVATTRPETMFGDQCLFINPKDERYKKYIGKTFINPANNQELPLLTDSYVDMEVGTGVLKCTPAHDPNDFNLGVKYNLKHPVIMNTDGTMSDECGIYSKLDRYECRNKLIEDLKNDNNLEKIEKITHSVGHSERSGAVVEPILSKQWYVKMKPLADRVLKQQKSSNKATFYPSRFNKILTHWMTNCEDWCISRQLWWGHRIPVYYNIDTNEILVNDQKPTNGNWIQDEDVLDTWFSSALWPFATLGWPENTEDFNRYYPLDCMSTGYDIIFFWVARMYFQGLFFTNKTPFKDILIHGLVRDYQGRKMSKSLGNGVDPFDVIDKYGADSLRYFIATNSAPGLDMRYIEEKVNSCSNYLNKIWNSARFILLKIPTNYEYKEDYDVKKLNFLELSILSKLQKVIKKITKYMDSYDYGIASTLLYNFVYDDFCSFYIEMVKVSLDNEEYNHEGVYFTLIKVLKSILMMIYPFSPFITEEMYLNLPNHKESIMLETYPKYESKYISLVSENKSEILKNIIDSSRNYKTKFNLAPNKKINIEIVSKNKFDDLINYINRFTFAEKLTFSNYENTENQGFSYVFSNFTMLINENINIDELKNQLEKEISRLNNEIKRSESLLNNDNFLKKAPQNKIDLEKEKYQNYCKELEECKKRYNCL
ncbi:MAG: valine--tRNA ligase [Bacillales bacterium]